MFLLKSITVQLSSAVHNAVQHWLSLNNLDSISSSLKKGCLQNSSKTSKLCQKYNLKLFLLHCYCPYQHLFTKAYQIHTFIIQEDEMPILLTVITRILVHVTQYLFTLDASPSHLKHKFWVTNAVTQYGTTSLQYVL
jgi:hypothetical protein